MFVSTSSHRSINLRAPDNFEKVISMNLHIIIGQIGIFSDDSKKLIASCIEQIQKKLPIGTHTALVRELSECIDKNNLIQNEPNSEIVLVSIIALKNELINIGKSFKAT